MRVQHRQLPASPPVSTPCFLTPDGRAGFHFAPAGWAFPSWDQDICLPQRSVSPLVINIRGDGRASEAL